MPPREKDEIVVPPVVDYTRRESVQNHLLLDNNTSFSDDDAGGDGDDENTNNENKVLYRMKRNDLQRLRKISGNEYCMDCGIDNPDWASINLGIFICLECSGKHRSLGTHISFVRSVFMDSWSDEQLTMMTIGGNDQCKEFLSKKGNTSTTIRDKYDSPESFLYQQVLKARRDGKPEPTELPPPSSPKTPTTNQSSSTTTSGQRKKVINIEGFGSPPEVQKPLVDKEAVSIFFKSSTEKLGNVITSMKRNSTERFIVVPTVVSKWRRDGGGGNDKQQEAQEEEEQQQQEERVVGQ